MAKRGLIGGGILPQPENFGRSGHAKVESSYNHRMLEQSVELSVNASSRKRPYRIEVLGQTDKVSVFCDCPAGALGRFCKHKAAVVAGDDSVLALPEAEKEEWAAACRLLAASSLPAKLMELKDAEKDAGVSKQQIKSLKLRISRLMQDGA